MVSLSAARRASKRSWLSFSVLWVACAHAGGPGKPGAEEILERGGELGDVLQPERTTLTVTPSTVTVWGLTEVPDGSRMDVAFAGVDAITRAELLKAIEVRLAGSVTSVESSDPSRRSVVVETVESVDGVLARSGPLPHGWARLRRDGAVVIRIWARLALPRAALETSVRAALAGRRGGPTTADPSTEPSTIIGGLAP
jgi:hypothetical protein